MGKIQPVDRERFFGEEEVIVSKTDLRGVITYANDIFCRVADYQEDELLGAPHSIVRHPDMPRCVFKYLWDTIESGKEVFAYVKNMARTGEYYWVFAHVTPTFNERHDIISYHSSRRCPDRSGIAAITPIYQALLEEEKKHADARKGLNKSFEMLVATLQSINKSYDEFLWSITP